MAKGEDTPDWCRRCGSRHLENGACNCVTAAGPEQEVAALVEAARNGRRARRWLAKLTNPEARVLLEGIVADQDTDAGLATAALSALSRIGAEESFMLSERAAALGSGDVIRYLRERGDERARTELVRRLGGDTSVEPFDSREAVALSHSRTTFDAPLRRSRIALEIDGSAGPVDHSGTRFGGQPTWLTEPTWPLTVDRTPMAFWGQFASHDESDRMVYVFVDPDDPPEEFDAAEASVFAQPLGQPGRPFATRSTGPAISSTAFWQDSQRSSGTQSPARARVPALEPFEEPLDWEDVRLETVGPETTNKIGGTPFWVRDPMVPPAGYEFVAQFDAERVGHPIGHAGTCYVFLHSETGDGWFGWQA